MPVFPAIALVFPLAVVLGSIALDSRLVDLVGKLGNRIVLHGRLLYGSAPYSDGNGFGNKGGTESNHRQGRENFMTAAVNTASQRLRECRIRFLPAALMPMGIRYDPALFPTVSFRPLILEKAVGQESTGSTG
jgi:hypothetical protein